jgi:hypothetical protein
VSRIKATKTFIAQTTSIPSTALFTPTAEGTFLVSIYMEQPTLTSESDVEGFLSWTDNFQTQPEQGIGEMEFGGFTHNAFVLHSVAGSPINFSTTAAASTTPYNVYAVVESL